MKGPDIAKKKKKKKILLYTCSHNYTELNKKMKKKKANVRQEGKYCTLAENLFHHMIQFSQF